MTLGPKTLRAPESGLIRLKSSFSAWGWGRKPTWAAPASSPAPRQSAAIGPTPRAIVESGGVHQALQPGGAGGLLRLCDLGEDLAEGGLARARDARAEQAHADQAGGQHERAADVGGARDLPFLAGAFAVFGGRLLGAVLLGHAQITCLRCSSRRASRDVQGAERGTDAG